MGMISAEICSGYDTSQKLVYRCVIPRWPVNDRLSRIMA
jgi:hypothetical protein